MKKNFYKPMLDKIPMQEPIKLEPEIENIMIKTKLEIFKKKEKEEKLTTTKCRFF